MRRTDDNYDILNQTIAAPVVTSNSIRPYRVKIVTLDMLKRALNNIERNQRIMVKKHQASAEKLRWSNDNSAEIFPAVDRAASNY